MTRDDLIILLLNRFCENFAETMSELVVREDVVEDIYILATQECQSNLSKAEREKVLFRAAYLLEKLYFNYPKLFMPFTERFYNDYNRTTSESAKRHFAKIMANLLRHKKPSHQLCEQIAETSVSWATNPTARVAVQIWAMEVLSRLKGEVDWLDDILLEILETLRRNPSPAMRAYLRRVRN